MFSSISIFKKMYNKLLVSIYNLTRRINIINIMCLQITFFRMIERGIEKKVAFYQFIKKKI